MNIIYIDGKELTSEHSTHLILKEKLELPDYYGENLNALWDCLTGWVSLPIKIIWNNFDYSKKNLGGFADELLELFKEAISEIEGFEIEVN